MVKRARKLDHAQERQDAQDAPAAALARRVRHQAALHRGGVRLAVLHDPCLRRPRRRCRQELQGRGRGHPALLGDLRVPQDLHHRVHPLRLDHQLLLQALAAPRGLLPPPHPQARRLHRDVHHRHPPERRPHVLHERPPRRHRSALLVGQLEDPHRRPLVRRRRDRRVLRPADHPAEPAHRHGLHLPVRRDVGHVQRLPAPARVRAGRCALAHVVLVHVPLRLRYRQGDRRDQAPGLELPELRYPHGLHLAALLLRRDPPRLFQHHPRDPPQPRQGRGRRLPECRDCSREEGP
mmetsp:Transcript_27326/g.109432  ORF Transcript_27326/g.109432 Transcript_27326/m.109432 type:complete len:293 (-) Transcript_27326:302-1180(-)